MRGVAAVAVMVTHYTKQGSVPGGYLAVDLFFMLSGVVIASAYDQRIADGMTSLRFMRLRYVRFYPLYLVGLLGGLILGASTVPVTPTMVIMSLAMLPTLPLVPYGFLYPPISVAWSLFMELVVNLGFVLLHRHLTQRRLLAIVLVAWLVITWGAITAGSLDIGARSPSLMFGFARTIFAFCFGVVIWRSRTSLTLALSPWIVLPLVAAALALPAPNRVFTDLFIASVLWPILVIGGSNAASAAPVLGWLGAISYPVYCLHIMFANKGLESSPVPAIIAACVGVIIVSWLADRYYDAPVRAWLLGLRLPARATLSSPPKAGEK